jgi:RHS repeat-associated protein
MKNFYLYFKVWTCLGLLCFSTSSLAQSGVSDNRVSLPEGPGNVGGFADNAEINLNMGSMSYSIKINSPTGRGDEQPIFSLSYSSMGGNTLLGMGWNMMVPSIERSTSKGLPLYQTGDRFVVNEAIRLVNIGEVASLDNVFEFRPETEGSFVRYRWHQYGQGKEGYWTTELPNGVIEYYGATSEGVLLDEARMGISSKGTFRYYLTERVDPFGNRAVYSYTESVEGSSGSTKLLTSVEYAFNDNNESLYQIRFEYEDRNDPLSDCRPGYCEIMGKRLNAIRVIRGGVNTMTYTIEYDELAGQADLSRIRTVKVLGADQSEYQGHFTFQYSKSLGMACNDQSCGEPYMVNMGTIQGSVRSGAATLIDLNGDALPDFLNTENGQHTVHYNDLQVGDTDIQSFLPAESFTQNGINTTSYVLRNRQVQTLDVDGNGFSDLVDYANRSYLVNNGNQQWEEERTIGAGTGFPDSNGFADTGVGDAGMLDNIRFFDYDQNGCIDMLKVTNTNTTIYSTAKSGMISLVADINNVGQDFNKGFQDGLELADMNGDGLQDLVLVSEGTVSYRLYMGYGQWNDEVRISVDNLPTDLLEKVELEDINGDGLTDLLIVLADELRYSLNQNERAFSRWYNASELTNLTLPVRDTDTTVLYADMNGNGSTDVVWIQPDGGVQFLELFPVRPNLMIQMENNLGMTTQIEYDASVREARRAANREETWQYNLPHPMTIVKRKVVREAVGQLDMINHYQYNDGFYDGINKQFRGYQKMTSRMLGDEDHDGNEVRNLYDLGNQPSIEEGFRRSGFLLESRKYGQAETDTDEKYTHHLLTYKYQYENCPLSGIPAAYLDQIAFVCQTQQESREYEGLDESESALLRSEYTYDGYGRRTRFVSHGVVSMGNQGCAPCDRDASQYGLACGPECLGDESYSEQTFVDPKEEMGGWRTDLDVSTKQYASLNSSIYTETVNYYDGNAFEGLPAGQFTQGLLHRTTQLVSNDQTRNSFRGKYNDFGQIIQELTPVGTVDGNGARLYEYDADYSLNIVKSEERLKDENGDLYSLVRLYEYDPIWRQLSKGSRFFLDTETLVESDYSIFEYDAFGRLIKMRKGGAQDGSTEDLGKTITYDVNSTYSKITQTWQTSAGEQVNIFCYDGMNRLFQNKRKIDDNTYLVVKRVLYDSLGKVIRDYKTYQTSTGECDLTLPQDGFFKRYSFDGADRAKEVILMDEDLFGTNSVERFVYKPRMIMQHDTLDTDSESPHFNTPFIKHYDGQNRLAKVERILATDADPLVYHIYFDEYGQMSGYQDPEGNQRVQIRDRVGQVLAIRDPNEGEKRFEYNDLGEISLKEDGRGQVTRYEYDSFGRITAFYEEGNEEETRTENFYDFPRTCSTDQCTYTAGKLAESRYPLRDLGAGMSSLGYNRRGKATYLHHQIGEASFEFESTYNGFDELTEEAFPGGTTLQYEYDQLSRLIGINSYLSNIEYSPQGIMKSVQFGNDVTTQYTYDSLDRMTEVQSTLPNGNPFVGLTATYNRKGHLKAIADQVNQGVSSHTKQFELDGLDRLIRAQISEGDVQETLTYAYSPLDNLTKKESTLSDSPAHVGSYTYDANRPNAVVSAGDFQYEYNGGGYVTSRNNQELFWDFYGRLSSVIHNTSMESNTDDMRVSEFYYGVGTERVAKVEDGRVTYYVSPNYEVRDGQGMVSLIVGDQVMARIHQAALVDQELTDLAPFDTDETNLSPMADGQLNVSDAWAVQRLMADNLQVDGSTPPEVDRLLKASTRRALFNQGTSDMVSYFHYDLNSNVVAVSNQDGELTDQAVYYPFGEIKSAPYGLLENHRYSSKERDETGFNYYGARYLDSKIGRFLSPDPQFEVLGGSEFGTPAEATGAYIFSNNNPVTFIDPDGRFGVLQGVSVGLAVVGGIAGGIERIRTYRSRDRVVAQETKSKWQNVKSKGKLGMVVLDVFSSAGSGGLSILANRMEQHVGKKAFQSALNLGLSVKEADLYADARVAKTVGPIGDFAVTVATVAFAALGTSLLITAGVFSAPVTGPAILGAVGIAAAVSGTILLGKLGYRLHLWRNGCKATKKYKKFKNRKKQGKMLKRTKNFQQINRAQGRR